MKEDMKFPRISTPAEEGVLSVSKWLKVQVLLDISEMNELIKALPPFFSFPAGQIVAAENAFVREAQFLANYTAYIEALKKEELLQLKPLFWTTSLDMLYAMQVGENKFLIKPLKPVIQLQAHHFFYSELDKKFHPMVLSKESVSWGLQFSYPQIYEDPKTHLFSKVNNSLEFPNTELFLALTRWLRAHSMPTPFIVEGQKVNVPIRIGKKAFSWINVHPQLKLKGISV